MPTVRRSAPHWSAWLAAWAIMLGALAPTVTHWLTHLQASNTLPGATICSSSAHKSSSHKGTHKGTRPDASAHGSHCGFCLPHDGNQGLLPTVALTPPPGEQRVSEPTLFLHAPRTLHAWASAQPRAPPLA